MKYILTIFLIFVSYIGFSQETKRLYVGISVSSNDNSFTIIQYEYDINHAYLRTEVRTNFDQDHRVYVKMAFRFYHTKNFSFYGAMMPFYGHIGKGYKTPINLEVQYKHVLVVNLDVYRYQPVLSIQIRKKL